jgi:hypothetical protein
VKKILAASAMGLLALVVQAADAAGAGFQQQLASTCNAEADLRQAKGTDRAKFLATCLSEGRKRQDHLVRTCTEAAEYKDARERRKFMAECLKKS